MAFLTTLINRLTHKEMTENGEQSDHYKVLEQLQRNHDWIDVTVTKTEKSYQSLVLNIDPDNHELVIDDLYPPEDLDKIDAGDTIEISSKSQKSPISFYTRILAREFNEGKGVFKVELPEEIGRNQSRQAYRVYVNNEEQLNIDAQFEDRYLDDVKIINLSTEGIKLSFSENLCEQFKHCRLLPDCVIQLPNGFDVDCDIELRNIYQIRSPHPHTLAGGKLKIKQPQQRVKLEQYLAAVQRQQRRRESRL